MYEHGRPPGAPAPSNRIPRKNSRPIRNASTQPRQRRIYNHVPPAPDGARRWPAASTGYTMKFKLWLYAVVGTMYFTLYSTGFEPVVKYAAGPLWLNLTSKNIWNRGPSELTTRTCRAVPSLCKARAIATCRRIQSSYLSTKRSASSARGWRDDFVQL